MRHLMVCGRCRYDLHGLNARGRCPECATPIRWSARRARLRLFADRLPVPRLLLGIGMLACLALGNVHTVREELLLTSIFAVGWFVLFVESVRLCAHHLDPRPRYPAVAAASVGLAAAAGLATLMNGSVLVSHLVFLSF